MASIPFDVLFDSLEPADLPLQLDPDDAVEIGAANNVVSTTVSMTKFRDGDGELIFSDEIPVAMYTEWRDFKDGAAHRHQWVRVELKVASKPNTISSGYSLVTTRWPRGNAWIYQTKFKPAWKGLKDQKPKPGGDVDTFPKRVGNS